MDLPVERYLAGGILTQLLLDVGPWKDEAVFPQEPADSDQISRSIEKGTEIGMATMIKELQSELDFVTTLSGRNFETRRSEKGSRED